MRRIASAPLARARKIWYASMINSLQSNGQDTPAWRMSSRFSKPPLKYLLSVSTLMHAAPPASYSRAMSTGSKSSFMMPLLGEAFFASAISAGLPCCAYLSLRAWTKSRAGGTTPIFRLSATRSIRSRCCAISSFLNHTISSRMFLGLSSTASQPCGGSSDGTSNWRLRPHPWTSLPLGGRRLMLTSSRRLAAPQGTARRRPAPSSFIILLRPTKADAKVASLVGALRRSVNPPRRMATLRVAEAWGFAGALLRGTMTTTSSAVCCAQRVVDAALSAIAAPPVLGGVLGRLIKEASKRSLPVVRRTALGQHG